jgi:hypothetical protein
MLSPFQRLHLYFKLHTICIRRTSGRSLTTFVRFEASAAKQMRTALFWAITQLITPLIFRDCPQTSVRNYPYSLRNNTEGRPSVGRMYSFRSTRRRLSIPTCFFFFLLLFYYILRMSGSLLIMWCLQRLQSGSPAALQPEIQILGKLESYTNRTKHLAMFCNTCVETPLYFFSSSVGATTLGGFWPAFWFRRNATIV